jgi:hypothetical protein
MLIGLSMSLIGVFLNWFKSGDSFNEGISYNGLSGPVYLAGYTIMLISIYSIVVLMKYLKENNCEFNQLKKYYVEKWSGIVILYLSILVVTVYLNSEIYSSLQKNIGVGFFMTVSGSLITTIGSIIFKTKTCSRKNKNQLDLDLHIPDTFDFSFHAENTLNDIKAINDPILKEQLRKQREIESKITNK